MKKLLAVVTILCLAYSINAQQYLGKKIKKNSKYQSIDQAISKMGTNNQENVKVNGTVTAVCKVKGCWMSLNTSTGESVRITFKDYGFFMPKDIVGKNVLMQGIISKNTTSIEELRHYAEDAGKTKEEIAKINQPKYEVSFEAEGVIIL